MLRGSSSSTLMFLLLLLFSSWVFSVSASVSYDHKAIIVNGQKRILISGSIHYPRSTPQVLIKVQCGSRVSLVSCACCFFTFHFDYRVFLFSSLLFLFVLAIFYIFGAEFLVVLWWRQMWPDLIQKAKEGGLDVIQTYVFWNGHEPSPGNVTQIAFYFDFAVSFF